MKHCRPCMRYYVKCCTCSSLQVVVNALFAAIPGIGNVLLVSLLFWLIFSILGVHLFAGKFFKCVDADNEPLPATIVPSKAECLKYPDKYRWENSKVTFDNVLAGFLTLMQVVSIFPFSQIVQQIPRELMLSIWHCRLG